MSDTTPDRMDDALSLDETLALADAMVLIRGYRVTSRSLHEVIHGLRDERAAMEHDLAVAVAEAGTARAALANCREGRNIEQGMLRNALPQLAALQTLRPILEAERERHTEYHTGPPGNALLCAFDAELWPCESVRVIDAALGASTGTTE